MTIRRTSAEVRIVTPCAFADAASAFVIEPIPPRTIPTVLPTSAITSIAPPAMFADG
jgi:hypothetical protein